MAYICSVLWILVWMNVSPSLTKELNETFDVFIDYFYK